LKAVALAQSIAPVGRSFSVPGRVAHAPVGKTKQMVVPVAWSTDDTFFLERLAGTGAPGPRRRAAAASTGKAPPAAPSWAALLQRFYVKEGLTLPRLERRPGRAVPSPFRALLVHSSDMTPTLENFYQQPLRLRVLSREIETDSYLREVVLELASDGRPVEYGVIRIRLDHFPPRARRRILEEQLPLGAILREEQVGHISWPQAFFRLEADGHIRAVLRLRKPSRLFGRRNVLLDGSRRLLAEVIEILAPVAPISSGSV
jgi:chorismate-pyruvate lyase